MKNNILQRPRRDSRSLAQGYGRGATVLATLLCATALSVRAMPIVDTLTGGPWQGNPLYYGYTDGKTATEAQFHTPYALILDITGDNMFVADRDNNAVRYVSGISSAAGQTYTFVSEGLNQPIGLALDTDGNLYVLNRGNGKDGRVLKYDVYGDLIGTNAVALTNAAAMIRDNQGNLYLTVESNKVIRISPGGTKSTVATISSAGASLRGIALKPDGQLAVCDSGLHGIYLVNPTTGAVTNYAGFHGAGDFTTQNNISSPTKAMFNQPYGIAAAGDGSLIVTDFGNHRVKIVLSNGAVTNLYGVAATNWYTGPGAYPGWWDGTVTVPDALGGVEARQPVGVLLASDTTVYVTETYYHLIRKVTSTGLPPPPPPPPLAPTIFSVVTNYGQVTLSWSVSSGATNYYVKRAPSSGGPYTVITATSATSYVDTSVINGTTYYYVVSASNAGGESPNSAEVSARPPLPPVPDPLIGYVDFPAAASPSYSSVFHPVSSFVFNNDAYLVIVGAAGSQTFYTFGNSITNSDVPDPTEASASAPAGYQDGLFESQVAAGYAIAQILPNLTIKAVGKKNDGSPDSAIVSARFQFVTANPVITGNNAAQFRLSDITAGAHLFYTIDGSDPSPTNSSAVDLGVKPTPTNSWTVSLFIQTNTLFKVRAFRDNYQPSAVVSTMFSATNFDANKISFGFAAGEASSDFVASPGQFFYAPVTLNLLPDTRIYSLQFNMTVTNAGPNPGPAIRPGAVDFSSFLKKPIPGINPPVYEPIPPLAFSAYMSDPPPASAIVYYDGLPFVDMTFVNTNNGMNLLAVGWLERFTQTNLYDSLKQDLITYSQAHDTMFEEGDGKVVVGGYAFEVPSTAQPSNTYEIQIGLPSATADGIGTPGAEIYIATPTNGSYGSGSINAIKHVTVGQRKYLVGDCAPFRWFNAGDYGNTNLDNSDVMQVFQSAIYAYNYPPYDKKSWNGTGYANVSDFYDSMDSCGYTYATNVLGYLVPDTNITDTAVLNGLFAGSDSTINYVAFGDGNLDVCDVYVTYRRSLDPSLKQFRRFWTNGVRGAEMVGGVAAPTQILMSAVAGRPSVNFSSGDVVGAAGQSVQIPVKGKIAGDYPIRDLMLSLNVSPLDGSPGLTTPVQFTPNPALGVATLSASRSQGEYAATWLNNNSPGLTGDAVLGTLTVQIPAGASSTAAYAVNLEHASASPNGLASFPKRIETGLITLADRSASTWGDGIPDAWRLRHFGSLNNVLSAASADADGDGVSNQQEYLAGTDPNDAASLLKLKSGKGQGQSIAVRWPSVASKQYVIERASSLYAPAWSPVSTNAGTGFELEFQDNSPGVGPRFYRVRAQ